MLGQHTRPFWEEKMCLPPGGSGHAPGWRFGTQSMSCFQPQFLSYRTLNVALNTEMIPVMIPDNLATACTLKLNVMFTSTTLWKVMTWENPKLYPPHFRGEQLKLFSITEMSICVPANLHFLSLTNKLVIMHESVSGLLFFTDQFVQARVNPTLC